MPAKTKADPAEVVPLVVVHHGTREFPKVAPVGVKCKLELDPDEAINAKLVKELIDAGKVLKVQDVPEDTDPAEVVAVANTVGAKL